MDVYYCIEPSQPYSQPCLGIAGLRALPQLRHDELHLLAAPVHLADVVQVAELGRRARLSRLDLWTTDRVAGSALAGQALGLAGLCCQLRVCLSRVLSVLHGWVGWVYGWRTVTRSRSSMDWIVSTIVSTGLWQRSPSSSSDSRLNVHPATPHFGPSLRHAPGT